MNTRPTFIVMIIGGVALASWIAYSAAGRLYFAPRDKLVHNINRGESDIARFTSALKQGPSIEKRLQAYADQTLGGETETVDHRLRARLNRLLSIAGFEEGVVNTGRASERGTPARKVFSKQRALRDAVDFVELPAWVTAEGTLEQAIRFASLVDHEPWLKHITQLKLDPRDNGDRVTLTLRLTTAFLPGRGPTTADLPAPSEDSLDRFGPVVQLNPFRLPPEEPPAAVVTAPPPKPAAGFPYQQWELTGVAAGAGGREAWLLNRSNSQSRILTPGQTIGDASLVEITDETAIFELDNQHFAIRIGRKLHDRTPLDR